MALIHLVSALLLGAAVVRSLRLPTFRFEFVALAVVLGLFGWVWIAFLAALLLPYAIAVPLTVVVALVVAGVLLRRTRTEPLAWRDLPGGRPGRWLWAGATVVTTLVLVPLFWTHNLPADAEGVWSAGSTWADYGLHAAIVSHLAVSDRMPMELPVADGVALTYPFLIDLLSALYLQGGWNLHISLFLPGVLLALAFCQLLMAFALRLFDHVGTAVAGLALVLTMGSAAGLTAAWSDWTGSGRTLVAFLGDLPRDYTALTAENGNVTNLVAHGLLPQRGLLFGLGIALTVLILFHEARETGERQHLLAGGVLIGLLPMAHAHSFLVLGAVLVALTVEAVLRDRRWPWAHLVAGTVALGLAAPQILWQQLANGSGSGGRFEPGWAVQDGESIWEFWAANFGLMGVFFVALPFLLARPVWRRHLVWYLPILAVLVVAHLYVFQPFEYDNLKLINYAYVIGGLFAAFLAVQAWRDNRWSLAIVLPVVLVVSIPGLLSITREFQLRDGFANVADVELAAWVRAGTEPEDVFLTTGRPNQPISTLGGRAIVLGYPGWLYSYNLPYADRQAAVLTAFQGRVTDPSVTRFGADYLAVPAYDDPSWPVDRAALTPLPVAFTNAEWTVYRLPDTALTPGAVAGG